MSKILIKLEKEDIKTSVLGENILIECNNNIDIIFTKEALVELINDYDQINQNL